MTERPSKKTLFGAVEEKARLSGGHPAILYGGQTTSYAELQGRAVEAAKALIALGAGPGSRVGVLLGNQPEWVILCLAASTIGATFVPLNTWYKRNELEWTLRHCGIKLLVAASEFLKADYAKLFAEMIPELQGASPGQLACERFPDLSTVAFIGRTAPGAFAFDEFLRSGRGIPDSVLADFTSLEPEDTPAFILYTSGSTAEPKGVLLNHRGVVENGFDLGERRGIVPEDRVWLGSPLFYGLGAVNALPATLTHGATLVLQGSFEAGAAIKLIHQTESSVYYGTGNMTRAILDHPDFDRRKTSSLKKGNAGTVAEYKRLTLVEMGISGAVPAYGLTESYGNATVGYPGDPLDIKLATNGTALPGMEIKIVDPETYRPLLTGATGLILLRGHTTPGYFNNPAETGKALLADGFFNTGDLGSLDGEGRLIFHSRLKEVIKSGGINVSPMEVEQLLAQHPDVRDAYVVGVAHPVKGELIVAFVDRAAPVGADSLRDYVKERAASFKTPHHILFRSEDQLPRLASGKIAKHRLAEEARRELGL
jgi:fatty-acyl-CoA synthase